MNRLKKGFFDRKPGSIKDEAFKLMLEYGPGNYEYMRQVCKDLNVPFLMSRDTYHRYRREFNACVKEAIEVMETNPYPTEASLNREEFWFRLVFLWTPIAMILFLAIVVTAQFAK